MVSKCHNPRCSAEFRYFGDGKLFEFTADSIRETSQLYWLCSHCSQTHSLERDSAGKVHFIAKHKQKRRIQRKRSAHLEKTG